MTLKDKLEIATYAAGLVVVGFTIIAGLWKGIAWLLRYREERIMDKTLVQMRQLRREQGSTPVISANPGAGSYAMFEKMVSLGKLARSPFGDGYILPEDLPAERRSLNWPH